MESRLEWIVMLIALLDEVGCDLELGLHFKKIYRVGRSRDAACSWTRSMLVPVPCRPVPGDPAVDIDSYIAMHFFRARVLPWRS
jgi:hypothetical protein